MIYFVAWICLSFFVATFADGKKIGFASALLLSLIFSPIVGLLFVIGSGPKEEEKDRTKFNAEEYNKNKAKAQPINVTTELERLAKLKASGHISDAEFKTLKERVINNR